MIYDIMERDTLIASIDMKDGYVRIIETLPVGLNLKQITSSTIKDRADNISYFKEWSVNRLLLMNKECITSSQDIYAVFSNINDNEKMKIALIYKCTVSNDDYWIKQDSDDIQYKDILSYRDRFYDRLNRITTKKDFYAFKAFMIQMN